jgi:hypothetical protein
MVRKIRQIAKNSPDQFAAALYQEASIESKECQRSTPVKTGNLRATIHVEGPTREGLSGRRIICAIVAGSSAITYALFVHENLEAFHETGDAKYIERPLNESAPYMAARIAARIDLNKTL